ncbi:hypothetical protein, unlikely [Trypanosoma brucei gambiense DAL972]|uniref:Uncharacterized protein n=1 Tax=Trypanosoma brucei gambiense (strain MHOM/CI/86/DAL972) TaxID=679716 RepID=D0A1T1_TRYB9|nr:hypothetical protein, unlikely [Trypanosoma brucei gambiense DAL972]CBH15224.1 hypothetical protein, unlikely [Trypanosoma brucei gambiense DAL972]|eukprot:XP_011777489.1 hypothetical protein, unlikely [Trypanosoma brucei gambiense DAL972]
MTMGRHIFFNFRGPSPIWRNWGRKHRVGSAMVGGTNMQERVVRAITIIAFCPYVARFDPNIPLHTRYQLSLFCSPTSFLMLVGCRKLFLCYPFVLLYIPSQSPLKLAPFLSVFASSGP